MSDTGSDKSVLRLLLTGGGTGGHLFPAVATAEQVRSTLPESAVLFVGTRRKLDRDSLARSGFSVTTIHSYGLKGKNLWELIKALVVLPFSVLESCYHILKFNPDVVMGVGGYVTGPVVAAAWLLRRPTLIHEQNSVPGLANRKLGGLVDRICLSLPQSEIFFPVGKSILTGNPVRKKIIEAGRNKHSSSGRRTLLILGGSQGAHAVNEMIVEALRGGIEAFSSLRVIHQTGSDDEQMVKQAYEEMGIDHLVAAFFTDMAELYQEADLIVSRAGATTLAEIGVVGTPAVLIPYPHAADNHQEKNGAWYVENGAALMFSQQDLTPQMLAEEILRIINDQARLDTMSESMKKLGIGDAAERIVDICLDLSRK
ncbi:MAG: undecaprenyldiphospho-muramoylpentapeptide beta-N-acetylglucosaminyltransferase [Desulfocapsaceae bacterium]